MKIIYFIKTKINRAAHFLQTNNSGNSDPYIKNIVCISMTFNNPFKACFSNKKYINYNPNTPDANCKSICLNEKKVFSGFLKFIGV